MKGADFLFLSILFLCNKAETRVFHISSFQIDHYLLRSKCYLLNFIDTIFPFSVVPRVCENSMFPEDSSAKSCSKGMVQGDQVESSRNVSVDLVSNLREMVTGEGPCDVPSSHTVFLVFVLVEQGNESSSQWSIHHRDKDTNARLLFQAG